MVVFEVEQLRKKTNRMGIAVLLVVVLSGGCGTGLQKGETDASETLWPTETQQAELQGWTVSETETQQIGQPELWVDGRPVFEENSDNNTETRYQPVTDGAAEGGETGELPYVWYDVIESEDQVQSYSSLAVVGDAAYEIFTYREETAMDYADAVTDLAEKMGTEAEIYSILVPLSSGITFPDNLADKLKSSDQKSAMEAIYDRMGNGVRKINIYETLLNHRTEYIYFRTDHHWTALGAYYAYEDYCAAKELIPQALEEMDVLEFDGFVGSFYTDTRNPALKENPDTLYAYLPYSECTMRVTDVRGKQYDWDVVHDVSEYRSGVKYSAFTAGDNPISVITNHDIKDGSSCIVVKESFGNAFVPFLVDHYETIYEIDYRYWEGTISEFARENGVKDILVINNVSMTRNQYLVGQLARVLR